MSKFTFRTPGGQTYEVQAPAGVSESQARAVFDQQFDTGSLGSLQAGQTLDAVQQASTGLTSALSQIQPGTSSPLNQAFNKLSALPVNQPLNAAEFLKTPVDTKSIGNLDASAVQGLMAQAKTAAGQGFDAVTAKGVGAYAIPPEQLERSGLLKPGTVKSYLGAGANVTAVLSSPTVWTGKGGTNSLDSFLSQPTQQAKTLQTSLSTNFDTMSKLGVIDSKQSPQAVAALLQSSSQVGVGAVQQWSKGAAPPQLVNQINDLARQGEFAVNFVDDKLPDALKGQQPARGFTGTVNRQTVDTAVTGILGSGKIPSPQYQTTTVSREPSASVTAARAYSDAVNEASNLRKTYQEVLKANNNDRLNADVVRAFDAFKAAQRRAEQLEKELGI